MDGEGKPRKVPKLAALALGVASWCLTGCHGETASELANVVVLVTDQPTEMLEAAEVWISRIYLQGSETTDEDGSGGYAARGEVSPHGRIDLFDAEGNPGARQVLDLLGLRDGATTDATGPVPVEAGSYRQLRFVVDSTRVVLKDGFSFDDGTKEQGFKVPSGPGSGIEVQLIDGVLEPAAGETVTVTVEFAVDESFVVQESGDPRVIRRILFNPVLREKERMTQMS